MGIEFSTTPASRFAQPRGSRIAITALLALAGAFAFVGLVLPSPTASAAVIAVNQCNNIGATPPGATTGVTCTVTVVNTINGGTKGSTTTVTRQCSLGPCPSGNGTFTTSSTSLVTNVTQCNGSANDAAPPRVTCRVRITNNIKAGSPGVQPVTAATVNQCVGTGTGGGSFSGHAARECDPSPASTTGATVTQCNGSVTGGGSSAVCSVASASKVSPAIPVRVNQCNGTGNKGGTLLTCSTSITTNITPAGGTGTTPGGTTPGGTRPPQVRIVPPGGIDTGGGSTAAGLENAGLLALGGLLILGAGVSALYGRRRSNETR